MPMRLSNSTQGLLDIYPRTQKSIKTKTSSFIIEFLLFLLLHQVMMFFPLKEWWSYAESNGAAVRRRPPAYLPIHP